MKVQKVSLKNFKRFSSVNLDFRDPETGLARDLIVVIGKNGSGKSSVLQAIAAMVGSATSRLSSPSNLDWPGFDLKIANEAWVRPIEVDIDVEFSREEIKASREYFSRTDMSHDADKAPPGDSSIVKLRYNVEKNRVDAPSTSQYFQFQGRTYARMILKNSVEGSQLFEKVGDIFWYTEHRTTNSLTQLESVSETLFDMDLLRRRMSDWFYFHERVQRGDIRLNFGRRDLFAEIEKIYQVVFPGRSFAGPVPRTEMEDVMAEPWFYLSDGNHQYELSEMSGGERAIFPMLFDFANWGINNSIVLIDEIELHLHPPLQQGLIKALQHFGKNNQFIITTHSESILSIVPESAICRL
jgi:predicted ATP-dependent endonuclease of OLD family